MKRLTTMILVLLGHVALIADADEQKAKRTKPFESADAKLCFEYPAQFVVGRYDESKDLTGFFSRAIALVEKSRLAADADPENLDIGVEAITIIPLNEKESKFWRALESPDFWSKASVKPKQITIGSHEATRLPGFPGPYGDNVYVYLVKRPDERIVLLMALKQFADPPRRPTGYDQTIEGIIKTLEWIRDNN